MTSKRGKAPEKSQRSKRANVDQTDNIDQQIQLRAILDLEQSQTLEGIKSEWNVRFQLSDYVEGAIERVATMMGSVSQTAKAMLSLLRPLPNAEGMYQLRLATAAMLTSAISGRQSSRLRQLSATSGASLHLADTLLPLSTERTLVIEGQTSAIENALVEVGKVYVENSERLANLPVVLFRPMSMAGNYGHPSLVRMDPAIMSPDAPYGIFPPPAGAQEAAAAAAAAASAMRAQQPPVVSRKIAAAGNTQTQQIFVPNDMIGAIIGRQGIKINEIRQASGCQIKISAEPTEDAKERMVSLTGSPESIKLGLYLLYQRLESEK